jgi:HAD hydrolase, family IA, variant 1|nr:HAD family hydrolase [uncultured Selenomonas sp.]
MEYHGVVFDVDDTLYDMSLPFIGAYERLYEKRYDLPLAPLFLAFRRYSDARFDDSQTGKMTMEELYIYRLRMAFRDYGVCITDEEALDFQHLYMQLQYRIQLSEVMRELLDALQERAALGIITNGDSMHQRNKLRSLNIAQWVPQECIIVSGDHAFRKPDVQIFREMEHRLGLAPEHLVYVGDAFGLDVMGAKCAGWQSVWFNHRNRKRPDKTEVLPDIEVHTEDALAALLLAV